jgi:orotate phosphoribosyltransferase
MKVEIARILLDKKAVTLSAKEPYIYTSGIISPIYCDNRSLAGFPQARKKIIQAFVAVIQDMKLDIVAGTSTAGIPWAAWIADRLDIPMAYIRSSAKGYGKGKQIEGADLAGKRSVVIEDLISTGKSSFGAVNAIRENGGMVNQVVTLFTYEFENAKRRFEEGDCRVTPLTDFTTLTAEAKKIGYLTAQELELVQEWNKAPMQWGVRYGFC